ncbi:MAG: GyrI-like domain-containing protein [Bacteroidota bacterium]
MILELKPMRLAGFYKEMSLIDNHTVTLWQSFIPHLRSLKHRVGQHLISLQEYPPDYFESFQPGRSFKKWALAEVSSIEESGEFEYITVHGMYAVFSYQGTPVDFSVAFQQILFEWLPNSGFQLDQRPHFEWLGKKYKRNEPTSEEEVWVPITQANVT